MTAAKPIALHTGMAQLAPDDIATLATLDVLRRGALVVGAPVADLEVQARVALRVHELRELKPADRAALADTLMEWMAPGTDLVAEALAAAPRGVRR